MSSSAVARTSPGSTWAGLVDEFQLHVVPVFLGQGTRLLEGLPDFAKLQIERIQVLASPTGVIHARYRVLKRAA